MIGRPTPVNESFSQLSPLVYLPQWCLEIIFYTSPGVKIEGKVFVHNRESMRHFKINCVPAQLFFGGVYCQQTADLRTHVSERNNCLRTRWKPRTRMYSRSWATSPNLCNRKTNFFFTHRALIVAVKAPDDTRTDDSTTNLQRDTQDHARTDDSTTQVV